MEKTLFQTALKSGKHNELKTISKADRHNHSMLGVRLERLEKLAGKKLKPFPRNVRSIAMLDEYIEETIDPYLKNAEDFAALLESAIEESVADGVTVLEMSIDCRLLGLLPTGMSGMAEVLAFLRKKYRSIIEFKPELGIARDVPISDIGRIVPECIESGAFLSIDLYGTEELNTPESYKSIYRLAQQKGMKLKAHAGEFCGPDFIRDTIETLELHEVQHGISAASSGELMRFLCENKIRVNICPSSNVVLGRVPSLDKHPIRTLFDHGVCVSINTDDILLFGKSVSEEYLALYQCGLFTAEELDKIRMDSLQESISII